MLVSVDDIRHFRSEGYFVLESIIPGADLAGLRAEAQKYLHLQIESMDRVGADVLGLSQKGGRFTLPCRHEESPVLEGFLFGDVLLEIIRATVGDDAYLLLALFSIKWSSTGTPFGWHQDSGYLLGNPHRPYVSLWCALDDTTEENGCLHILPYSRAESTGVVEHSKDKKNNDLIGYRGSDPGVAVPIPAGSIIVMSSTTFHRSGTNITPEPRRAFLASYSPEPITDRHGRLWNMAVPFIENGVRVYKPETTHH
jgi:phytanoyl-CoA dioxygenase PhyH